MDSRTMNEIVMGPEPHVPDDAPATDATIAVTRRTLLKLGAAAISGIAAAQLLDGWAPALAAGSGGPIGPTGDGSAAGAAASPNGTTPHEWAFGCDASRCLGCGRCVEACKLENGVPLEAEYNRTWVERHVVATDGSVFVDSPEAGLHGFPADSTAPGAPGPDEAAASYFVPRLCMQCDDPPCVSVCPVSATYKTDGGVVLVDQERCIGCGYCVVACPYGARYLVPSGGHTPTEYSGVADKCTWCFHRINDGRLPACVEVCPAGARVFGDLLDDESPISAFLREKDHVVLKPEVGTKPRVFYAGLEAEAK